MVGCEARFAAKSSMYVHVKKHEQQLREGKLIFFCPMEGCDRKYNNKNTLRQHISKHYHDTLTQGEMSVVSFTFLGEWVFFFFSTAIFKRFGLQLLFQYLKCEYQT